MVDSTGSPWASVRGREAAVGGDQVDAGAVRYWADLRGVERNLRTSRPTRTLFLRNMDQGEHAGQFNGRTLAWCTAVEAHGRRRMADLAKTDYRARGGGPLSGSLGGLWSFAKRSGANQE